MGTDETREMGHFERKNPHQRGASSKIKGEISLVGLHKEHLADWPDPY